MAYEILAEVFGYRIDDRSSEATRARDEQLCPYHNIIPNCTKDSRTNPLGVCSINHAGHAVITCPIRFTEDWLMISRAADFLFPSGAKWTSLKEVTLTDRDGREVGNIDYVLVSYDENGQLLDFGSVEVQAVYISGNVRNIFTAYIKQLKGHVVEELFKSPHPDYLSSSRKRLAPQLISKGRILRAWGKKQVVVLQRAFYETLPSLPESGEATAEMAWMLYDLELNDSTRRLSLRPYKTIYTHFETALERMTVSHAGNVEDFIAKLQRRLSDELNGTKTKAR